MRIKHHLIHFTRKDTNCKKVCPKVAIGFRYGFIKFVSEEIEKINPEVSKYIENSPEEQTEIMKQLRQLIHENVEDLTEEFKWSRPVFRSKKDFAYFQSNKNHVNLGFYSGFENLGDPNGLLEGGGKMMRHLKLRKASEIDSELLANWFQTLTN